MKRSKLVRMMALVAAGGLLTGLNASAGITFTASGSGGDGPEGAQATFTLNNGSVTIVLTSLEANPTAAGQEVSSIQFNISGATGTGSDKTGDLGSGNTSSIGSGGAYTPTATSPLAHWGDQLTAGTILLQTAGSAAVGGKPNDLIIGPDSLGDLNGTGLYHNANPSIIGHEPVVLGSATFTIADAGVTTASTISGVIFGFGTGPDSVLDGTSAPVPEPTTMLAGALLLLPFGASTVRVLRRKQAA